MSTVRLDVNEYYDILVLKRYLQLYMPYYLQYVTILTYKTLQDMKMNLTKKFIKFKTRHVGM